MSIKIGDIAPDFTTWDQDKSEFKLSDYRGSWVLLYFYPKDDTPGCTVQACSIRDNYKKLKSLKLNIFGLSKDTANSHKRFIDKFDLPFTLLVDKDKKIAEMYSSLAPKKFMGREYMGVCRNVFLINPEGIIVKIDIEVDPEIFLESIIKYFKQNVF